MIARWWALAVAATLPAVEPPPARDALPLLGQIAAHYGCRTFPGFEDATEPGAIFTAPAPGQAAELLCWAVAALGGRPRLLTERLQSARWESSADAPPVAAQATRALAAAHPALRDVAWVTVHAENVRAERLAPLRRWLGMRPHARCRQAVDRHTRAGGGVQRVRCVLRGDVVVELEPAPPPADLAAVFALEALAELLFADAWTEVAAGTITASGVALGACDTGDDAFPNLAAAD